MRELLSASWRDVLSDELNKPYFAKLSSFVDSEYAVADVFPPRQQIFRAFDLCSFDDVKVVILGQDPYHEPSQAEGLSFSVPDGVRQPPSLVNIFKELDSDLAVPRAASGSLVRWAEQGVLLLNATLTVKAHRAGSHQKQGWETFTDSVIRTLAEKKENVVFILWGAYAAKKSKLIGAEHKVITSAHPSPLSSYRGFFGSRPFSQCNDYLRQKGYSEIYW